MKTKFYLNGKKATRKAIKELIGEERLKKMLAEARKQIKQEKDDALNEIRSQIAVLSMAVAEKVIGKELEGSARQHEYIERLVDEKIEEERKTE